MSPEQELFMVLARLRCNLLEQDLAIRYCIHQNESQPSSLLKALSTIIPHAFGAHDECEAWCRYKQDPNNYKHSDLPRGKKDAQLPMEHAESSTIDASAISISLPDVDDDADEVEVCRSHVLNLFNMAEMAEDQEESQGFPDEYEVKDEIIYVEPPPIDETQIWDGNEVQVHP
ncbi:hypothetical protein QZH41_000233 [Actinostola sp. cb2023]|nr:hypothetical protein QZH41_000233 [Actinostola sp. cb2023]